MANAFKLITRYRSGIAVLDLANRLAQLPEVRLSEPNMIITGRSGSVPPSVYQPEPLPVIPNDPEFPNCWGLHNTGQFPGSVEDVDIDAPEAWTFTTGDSSVIIVVIDVGVDQGHLDINQAPGNDFTNEPGAVRDGGPVNACDNHGTEVAGVATAIINNSRGTVGAAPGARIASARVMKSDSPVNGICPGTWDSEPEWTIAALEWAQSIGARVTINSNMYNFESSCIEEWYQETRDDGMIHFASAGTDVPDRSVTYPASLPGVNAVSAITWDGSLATFSSYGSKIAYTAPGDAIFTTDRTGQEGDSSDDISIGSGTSFAAPMVAGAAALLLSAFPSVTVDALEGYLQISAVDLGAPGKDDFFGSGLVNAHIALKVAAIEAIFIDGFESGGTSNWSSTEP
jgi:subtilisin family serine protease